MVKLSDLCRFAIKIKGNGGTLYDDFARVQIRGGKGGNGKKSYGGIGGDGGNVYLKAAPNHLFTMTHFLRANKILSFVAPTGENSSRLNVIGEKGGDLYVKVPAGITIETRDRKILGELNKPDEIIMVAKGGEGGSAKYGFKGQVVENRFLYLHLKLIADIGFVGFPNAGKSTLLKALSRTEPMISPIPFTTIRPQIGMMMYDDYRRISLADLPGLIEGAHVNEGMGHRFLKHVERTMMLMFVVDINGFQLSVDDQFRNAYETIMLLNRELELYDPILLDKPAILCVNKSDTDFDGFKFKKLLAKLERRDENFESLPYSMKPGKIINFLDILPICAKSKKSALELKLKLRNYLDLIDDMKKKRMTEKYDEKFDNQIVEVPSRVYV